MKPQLLYRDRDDDPAAKLPSNEAALRQDLELDRLFGAMAEGDKFLFEVARRTVMLSLVEPDAIEYRQRILADCMAQPAVIREIYALAVEAIDREHKVHHWMFSKSADGVLHESLEALRLFVELLRRLRGIAEVHAPEFTSEGISAFFAMLIRELDEAYLGQVEGHLKRLEFREGVLISAELGLGVVGKNYVLRRPSPPKGSWLERFLARERSGYMFQIAERDEAGYQALTALRNEGVSLVAAALGRSSEHILNFFGLLRAEVGFYVGCLNVLGRVTTKGEPICFPEPIPPGQAALSCHGLYDICLALSVAERVVGNDVEADRRRLVVITGANRGGKSTFLRSVGVAELMMQCGMFVPAESFRGELHAGIFTHFRREEDATMTHGKLDEELDRMSSLVEELTPSSLLLLNESFASTNEREGSEISRQIVRALVDVGVEVVYVTHMYDLAHGFYVNERDHALFLRAERQADGTRTFRLDEGEPLPTSYGEDVYRRIFGRATTALS